MTATNDLDLRRLAEAVQARRLQIGLSIREAATTAAISKDTWMRVERGDAVRHLTYDKIDSILGWTAGDCTKIARGGEPVAVSKGVTISEVGLDEFEEAVQTAIESASIATTDLSAPQIRALTAAILENLRRRGVLQA